MAQSAAPESVGHRHAEFERNAAQPKQHRPDLQAEVGAGCGVWWQWALPCTGGSCRDRVRNQRYVGARERARRWRLFTRSPAEGSRVTR